jgi:hypothetical protein
MGIGGEAGSDIKRLKNIHRIDMERAAGPKV